MATKRDAKPTSRVLWVDRFLAVIRITFVVVIAFGLLAFIEALIFIAILLVALAYAWRKGALEWS